MTNLVIRTARLSDAERISEIYAPYVKETAITFEYDAPDAKEMERRIDATLKKYPYLVAERDGVVVGYAYAGTYYGRAAYDWCCELSVYVDASCRRQQIGSALYHELESILKGMGMLNLYACITTVKKDAEDPHITDHSVRFHEHLGYIECGRFVNCGYKFNRWYDTVYMVKMLGEHTSSPQPVINFLEYTKTQEKQ